MRHPRTAILVLIATAVAGFAAADLANPGYDPIAETASRYVNGTAGWLIPATLTAMAVAAVLLWRRLRGVGAGRAAALLVFGFGLGAAAVFPADPPGQYHAPSTSEMVHGLGGWTAFIALPIAALLLSGRIGGRGLRATAWATVVATAMFAVLLVDVMGGPSLRVGSSESLVGLAERVALAADLAWLGLAALASGKRADPEGSAGVAKGAASGSTGASQQAAAGVTGPAGVAAPGANGRTEAAGPASGMTGCGPRATATGPADVAEPAIAALSSNARSDSDSTGREQRTDTGRGVPASGTGSSVVGGERG